MAILRALERTRVSSVFQFISVRLACSHFCLKHKNRLVLDRNISHKVKQASFLWLSVDSSSKGQNGPQVSNRVAHARM